jgi:uncharacterized RDD family membrane protein YckC
MVVIHEKPVLIQASDVEYASFGERAVAMFVDILIIAIPSMFVPFIAPWLYFALLEGSAGGATVGKKMMGLRVLTTDGKRIGFGVATGRYFANFLNVLTGFLGYFIMLFSGRNQCLHDVITSTVVVRVPKDPVEVLQTVRQAKPVREQAASAAKKAKSDDARVWNLQKGSETHYLRLTEEGGQYLHRTPQGDFTDRFTLWQLADGKANYADAFGETVYREMQEHAEQLMMRLSES